jgi:hypothetical protein
MSLHKTHLISTIILMMVLEFNHHRINWNNNDQRGVNLRKIAKTVIAGIIFLYYSFVLFV